MLHVTGMLVWLLALWLPAGPALAQVDGIEQVRDYLDHTQEVLSHARKVVTDSESARAHHILREAINLQQQAEDLWTQGRPRQAHQVSSRARRAARLSVRVARDEHGFEERTRMRLERLQDLHDQVLDRALEVNDQRALRFVREAERQFQRAREHYAQHSYEMAFNLLKSAEISLHRATRLLFEGGGPARLEYEVERTRDLLANTGERLGDDPDPFAKELLTRAYKDLEQAREAVARGEPLRAVHLLRQARRQAGRAISASGGGPAVETIQIQLHRWDVRYAEMADAVRESGSEEAGLLLERAQRFRQRAGELLQDDDRVGSLRQIKIAHDLLNEALELTR